jgi:hypothetical protein
MSNGNAYVNVHTDKYPDGAIRGQITGTSASSDAGMSTNATTASTDTGADTNATSGNTTSDGQQESTSSQSTDSPNMDVE